MAPVEPVDLQVEPFTGDSPLKAEWEQPVCTRREHTGAYIRPGTKRPRLAEHALPGTPAYARSRERSQGRRRGGRPRRSRRVPSFPSVHVARAGPLSPRRDECSPTIPPRSHRASGSSVRAGSASISACPRRREGPRKPQATGRRQPLPRLPGLPPERLRRDRSARPRSHPAVTAARARRDRVIAAQRSSTRRPAGARRPPGSGRKQALSEGRGSGCGSLLACRSLA